MMLTFLIIVDWAFTPAIFPMHNRKAKLDSAILIYKLLLNVIVENQPNISANNEKIAIE
jgi:hypothetical protein